MEITNQSIVNYYQNTASGPYDRWGGNTGAYHFGYFSNPNINILGKQPEDIQRMHINSHKKMLELATKFVAPKQGELIIDAGCGSGSMLPYLSESGANVVGVNITPSHLLKAQNRIHELGLNNATVILADFADIPLHNNTVDRMLFFESLTHAPNQERVLHEADRLLRTGGEISIIEPMLTETRSFLDANTYFSVREVDKGMCLQVSSSRYLTDILKKMDYSIQVVDITSHVLPSIQLAAASAEGHRGEDAPEAIFRHRSATIAYRDLAATGKLKYVMIKAVKNK